MTYERTTCGRGHGCGSASWIKSSKNLDLSPFSNQNKPWLQSFLKLNDTTALESYVSNVSSILNEFFPKEDENIEEPEEILEYDTSTLEDMYMSEDPNAYWTSTQVRAAWKFW